MSKNPLSWILFFVFSMGWSRRNCSHSQRPGVVLERRPSLKSFRSLLQWSAYWVQGWQQSLLGLWLMQTSASTSWSVDAITPYGIERNYYISLSPDWTSAIWLVKTDSVLAHKTMTRVLKTVLQRYDSWDYILSPFYLHVCAVVLSTTKYDDTGVL